MENKYLKITKIGNDVEISSNDGVFSSTANISGHDSLINYCKSRTETWLNSNLENFDRIKPDERKLIAEKWLKVINLPEGGYNFFFNTEKKDIVFKHMVKEFAKMVGIKYKLEILSIE